MVLSKDYENFKKPDQLGKIYRKNHDNWSDFIQSSDDLDDLISNCSKKHRDYFSSEIPPSVFER